MAKFEVTYTLTSSYNTTVTLLDLNLPEDTDTDTDEFWNAVRKHLFVDHDASNWFDDDWDSIEVTDVEGA